MMNPIPFIPTSSHIPIESISKQTTLTHGATPTTPIAYDNSPVWMSVHDHSRIQPHHQQPSSPVPHSAFISPLPLVIGDSSRATLRHADLHPRIQQSPTSQPSSSREATSALPTWLSSSPSPTAVPHPPVPPISSTITSMIEDDMRDDEHEEDSSPFAPISSPTMEHTFDQTRHDGNGGDVIYRTTMNGSPIIDSSYSSSGGDRIQLAPFGTARSLASMQSSGQDFSNSGPQSPSSDPQPTFLISPQSRADLNSASSSAVSSARVSNEDIRFGSSDSFSSTSTTTPFQFPATMAAPSPPPPPLSASSDSHSESLLDADSPQWHAMQDHTEEDADENERDESSSMDDEEQKDSESAQPIGDISMLASTVDDVTQKYHPFLLQDDFASVKMQDEYTLPIRSRRGSKKESDHEHLTNNDSSGQRNSRRKVLNIATTKLTMPMTPIQRPKRIQMRRNSEVVPSYATRAKDTHPASSASLLQHPSSSQQQTNVVTSIPSTITKAPSSHETILHKSSHKRKSLKDEQKSLLDRECDLCSSCIECGKHWRRAYENGLKHVEDHGHIHSKSSANNSPLLRVNVADAPAADSTSDAMLISPAAATTNLSTTNQVHPASPATKSRTNRATHNALSHHGCCKPNYAVRTGLTLNDSPQHTSLALGPSFTSRKEHHKMLHGHSYEVGQLLDVRVKNGEIYYLVSWKGFPDIFNSWEPLTNLQMNCITQLEQFEDEIGTKIEMDEDDSHATMVGDHPLTHDSDSDADHDMLTHLTSNVAHSTLATDTTIDHETNEHTQANHISIDHTIVSHSPPPPPAFINNHRLES